MLELSPEQQELKEARNLLQWAREKNDELRKDHSRLVGEVNRLQLLLQAQREKHLVQVRELERAHSKAKAERRSIERLHKETVCTLLMLRGK